MHHYVHSIVNISHSAVQAIEHGDALGLAAQMNLAQALFDTCCTPNCPEQLTAPRLHTLMNDQILRGMCLAVKGVGSQGDGSAQLLCANASMQFKVNSCCCISTILLSNTLTL